MLHRGSRPGLLRGRSVFPHHTPRLARHVVPQWLGLPVPASRAVVSCRVSFRSGRLVSLQYNVERPDIPSLRLVWCRLTRVPQRRSRQGKITALAVAFIVATEIHKQLQQALLLPRAGDES